MKARAHPFIQAALGCCAFVRERVATLLEVGKDPDKFMKELGIVTAPLGRGANEQEAVGREACDVAARGIASGDCAAASIPGFPSTSIAGDQGSGFSDRPIPLTLASYLLVSSSDATISASQPVFREDSSLKLGPQPSTFPFDFGSNTQEFDTQWDNRVLQSLDDILSPGAIYSLPFSDIMGLGHVVPGDTSQTCFDENANEDGHVERRGITGFSTSMQKPDFTTLVSMSIDSSDSSSNTPNVQQDVRGLASRMANGNSVIATASNPELIDLTTLGYSD